MVFDEVIFDKVSDSPFLNRDHSWQVEMRSLWLPRRTFLCRTSSPRSTSPTSYDVSNFTNFKLQLVSQFFSMQFWFSFEAKTSIRVCSICITDIPKGSIKILKNIKFIFFILNCWKFCCFNLAKENFYCNLFAFQNLFFISWTFFIFNRINVFTARI